MFVDDDFALSDEQKRIMVSDFVGSNSGLISYCAELYALRKLADDIEAKIADEYGNLIVNTILCEITENNKVIIKTGGKNETE